MRKVASVIVIVVAIVALFAGTLHRTQKLQYNWRDIIIEETDVFVVNFDSTPSRFLPERVSKASSRVDGRVSLYAGLGRITFDGRNQSYVFVYIVASTMNFRVGPKSSGWSRYVLAFLSNSSVMAEVFTSYGLPHTHVKAYFSQVVEDSIYRTYMRLDLPDRYALVELSALMHIRSSDSREYTSDEGLYCLNGDNLTALYLTGNFTSIRLNEAHLNVTFAEDSKIWKYLGWSAYATEKPVRSLYLVRNFEGQIGCAEWR